MKTFTRIGLLAIPLAFVFALAGCQASQKSEPAKPDVPKEEPKASEGEEKPEEEASATILERLEKDGNYTILLAALKDSGVDKTLEGKGKFTFFAPNNKAFEKVPTLAELLGDKEKLGAILRHHIIAGQEMTTKEIAQKKQLTPLEGEPLEVEVNKDEIEINDAKIVQSDIRASNGIYHGIDHVLMKENDSMLREFGSAVERGLKKGAKKIEDAVNGDDDSGE